MGPPSILTDLNNPEPHPNSTPKIIPPDLQINYLETRTLLAGVQK